MDLLVSTIRTRLMGLFQARRTAAMDRGRSLALAGLSSEEAYRVGRAEGFWEGVQALLTSGLIRPRDEVPVLPPAMRCLVEESH